MEMIMSTMSGTVVRRSNAVGGLLATVGAAAKSWWGAYIAGRLQRATIAELKSMSDRELHDIGLTRSQIEAAARGDSDRDRRMITHF
jgi:uncharacterized protein YjiS (DUF1127 family)